MNKKEREALCTQIAQWEWAQGGSSSEAVARANCARDMISLFALTDEDMAWSRAYEIYKITKNPETEDEDYLDALCDCVDANYPAVLDRIGENGFDNLRETILADVKD